jgi:putative PIN family toxin of toxin-antitoxin system
MTTGTTPALPRVVLDTVVFVQSLISGRGASAGCIERLKSGKLILLMSEDAREELREVPLRPELTRKYSHLTEERVQKFVADIDALAVLIAQPPNIFSLPRDPRDEPFIDLAVAGNADYIVTWNERHLTYLMKRDTSEGQEFCARFPNIRIVSPAEFLRLLGHPRHGA